MLDCLVEGKVKADPPKAKCPISYYNILKVDIDLQTIEHNHFNQSESHQT